MDFSMFKALILLVVALATLCYFNVLPVPTLCKRSEPGLQPANWIPTGRFAQFKLQRAHLPKHFHILSDNGYLEIEFGPSDSNLTTLAGQAARNKLNEFDAQSLAEFRTKMQEVTPFYPQNGGHTTRCSLCDGKGGLNDDKLNGKLKPFDPEETELDRLARLHAKGCTRHRSTREGTIPTEMVCPCCAGTCQITCTQPCQFCNGRGGLDKNHDAAAYDPDDSFSNVRVCKICNMGNWKPSSSERMEHDFNSLTSTAWWTG